MIDKERRLIIKNNIRSHLNKMLCRFMKLRIGKFIMEKRKMKNRSKIAFLNFVEAARFSEYFCLAETKKTNFEKNCKSFIYRLIF